MRPNLGKVSADVCARSVNIKEDVGWIDFERDDGVWSVRRRDETLRSRTNRVRLGDEQN